MSDVQILEYQTSGTCCRLMRIAIDKNDIIKDAEFIGGCNGNLKGIKSLIKGMKVDDVIEKLNGIYCGDKATSCPDQLAKCLVEYKQKVAV
ncbi:MAG: TIGR03905 family TSCPD domain-containing protein [Candidatus Gastranaerophilaceae bacterium]